MRVFFFFPSFSNTVPSSVDSTPPVVSSLNDVIRQLQPGQTGGTNVIWTEPTATDNSGSVTLTARSHFPGQFFPVGSTTVTYTFSDGSGNIASTSFNVIVQGKFSLELLFGAKIMTNVSFGWIYQWRHHRGAWGHFPPPNLLAPPPSSPPKFVQTSVSLCLYVSLLTTFFIFCTIST